MRKILVIMSNNPKILIIGPDSQGGITSVIKMYLQNGLDEAEFLSSYISGNKLKQFIHYVKFLFKYFKKLLNKNIKIIHIHTASRGSFLRKFIAFNIAKLFKKKILFHIHPSNFIKFYDNSSKIVQGCIKKTLINSDLLVVIANTIKQEITTRFADLDFRMIYNPVIMKEFNSKESANSIKVLFMGRLGQNKGVYDIIEAAKYINGNNLKISLYGDGNIEEFQNLVKKYCLQDKVLVKGWISGEEKEKIIRESDISILPSYTEGLPMSVLEAMSYGLPIISTPVGGTSEAVEDGVNGFLIQPGDYKALAEKIDLLASNKELIEQMGQESFRIAKEKFDINIIINQLKELYEEVLEKKI